jgi:putative DNA methylase
MKWSFAEFDASRKMMPWNLEQIIDAYIGLVALSYEPIQTLIRRGDSPPITRLTLTRGSAQSLSETGSGSIRLICVDPPYYDNVQYAECSNFFYVWHKRTLASVHPELVGRDELASQDDEAVANLSRFRDAGRKAKSLAAADYENKMAACFREMSRTLANDGVVTVMFTHKEIQAWDTLGSALVNAGLTIGASWPVHTEFDNSLHQAKKNAAASTILLVCRKREKASAPVWWEDLKGNVRETARKKAAEFEQQGIKGVDLYISTFGPVLSIISESWPVLTSETDPKTGDPLPLKPGEALDLAPKQA